jgi:hypothetical protein
MKNVNQETVISLRDMCIEKLSDEYLFTALFNPIYLVPLDAVACMEREFYKRNRQYRVVQHKYFTRFKCTRKRHEQMLVDLKFTFWEKNQLPFIMQYVTTMRLIQKLNKLINEGKAVIIAPNAEMLLAQIERIKRKCGSFRFLLYNRLRVWEKLKKMRKMLKKKCNQSELNTERCERVTELSKSGGFPSLRYWSYRRLIFSLDENILLVEQHIQELQQIDTSIALTVQPFRYNPSDNDQEPSVIKFLSIDRRTASDNDLTGKLMENERETLALLNQIFIR